MDHTCMKHVQAETIMNITYILIVTHRQMQSAPDHNPQRLTSKIIWQSLRTQQWMN